MKMLRRIKKLFGVYESNYEYWVYLNNIKIKPSFKAKLIGKNKYKNKWDFYRRNGYCESKIILDKDFTLLDGYSSYKIYRAAEGINAKVPVYFV